ncbi:hypothetical protein HPB47_007516 [Ixodes persulcatus]|uniref:Uncharacterized protein n=1 Tax=Ixodes persulcatus TaxID=34615 RepID=A0AC60P7A4_IXOPE|nr:hypothetical protein HPB47_007516 [Ixodes persulcatus]
MNILNENDPGLCKKRSMFDGKASLSEVLREAKKKAEMKLRTRRARKPGTPSIATDVSTRTKVWYTRKR